jgi:hypothetical protein
MMVLIASCRTTWNYRVRSEGVVKPPGPKLSLSKSLSFGLCAKTGGWNLIWRTKNPSELSMA